jgi:hypothetical protein
VSESHGLAKNDRELRTLKIRIHPPIISERGSHGQSEHGRKVFRDRFARLENVTRDCFALPLIAGDSKPDDFVGMDFQLTHTIRSAAVALLFQKLAAKNLYSSTVHFRDCRLRPSYDIGYADAIGVPLLSTESAANSRC